MQSLPSWPLNRCSAQDVQKIRYQIHREERGKSHVLNSQSFLNACLLLAIYTISCTWDHKTRNQSRLLFVAHQVLSFLTFSTYEQVVWNFLTKLYLITCKLFLRILWFCCFSVLISKKFLQIRLHSLLLYLFLEVIFGLDCNFANCWQHCRKTGLHYVLEHFVKTNEIEQTLNYCLSALWGKCLFLFILIYDVGHLFVSER